MVVVVVVVVGMGVVVVVVVTRPLDSVLTILYAVNIYASFYKVKYEH